MLSRSDVPNSVTIESPLHRAIIVRGVEEEFRSDREQWMLVVWVLHMISTLYRSISGFIYPSESGQGSQ
jgi:hypothetical protein